MSSPFKEGSSFASLQGAAHRATLASTSEVSHLGLVPTTTGSYVAPGADYSFLGFTHVHGCHNAFDEVLDDMVRKAVIGAAPATMKELEVLVQGFLMGKDCSATCGLNKDSTTGPLIWFNSNRSSVYTLSVALPPSVSLHADSQMVVQESVPSASQDASSVPTVVASSWSPSPIDPVHYRRRRLACQTLSSSGPSVLDDLFLGERLLYGSKFRLDCGSDESFVPTLWRSRARLLLLPKKRSPSGPVPSTTITVPPREGILMEDRRKKVVVPEVMLRYMQRRLAPPADTRPLTIESTTPSPLPFPLLPSADVLPSSGSLVWDMPMAMESGWNTEATGLGDSIHAHLVQHGDSILASSPPPSIPPSSPSGYLCGSKEETPPFLAWELNQPTPTSVHYGAPFPTNGAPRVGY